MFIKLKDHPVVWPLTNTKEFISGMKKIMGYCEQLYEESNGANTNWIVKRKYLVIYDALYRTCGIWEVSRKRNLVPKGLILLDKNEEQKWVIRGNSHEDIRPMIRRYISVVRSSTGTSELWKPYHEPVSWDYNL